MAETQQQPAVHKPNYCPIRFTMVLPEDVKVLPEFMDWEPLSQEPLPEQQAGRP